MSERKAGEAPFTLIDYFPDDFLIMVDESHVTMPQVRAMYNGDRARKESLIEYGFRLPSALDNRPLQFDEFVERINQIVYVSATPGPYEMEVQTNIAEQIIRPTGLLIHPLRFVLLRDKWMTCSVKLISVLPRMSVSSLRP